MPSAAPGCGRSPRGTCACSFSRTRYWARTNSLVIQVIGEWRKVRAPITDVKAPHCFDTPIPHGYLCLTLNYNTVVLFAPVLLFSVIAHEYAHGYAALKQGDTTALSLGRLTWNPLKHIGPFMTIILPLLLVVLHGPILGGAKPVPVNPRNYRKFKQGDIIVSLAGVATNLLIALISAGLIAIFGLLGQVVPALADPLGILQAMGCWSVLINIELLLFNLLPIPPLDGSHVMKYILPPAWSLQYQRLGFYGIIILVILLQTRLLGFWLAPGLARYGALVRHQMYLPSAGPWLPP